MLRALDHIARAPRVASWGLDGLPHVLQSIQSFLVDLRRVDLVRVLASYPGNPMLLQFVLTSRPVSDDEVHRMLSFVCQSGRIELIACIESILPPVECLQTEQLLQEAVANGHVPVAQWLQAQKGSFCSCQALCQAASNGHLAICKWVLDDTCSGQNFSSQEMQLVEAAAVRSGQLDVVDLVCVQFPRECLEIAVREGQTHVMEFLCRKFPKVACLSCLFGVALMANQLELAKWIDSRRQSVGETSPELPKAPCVNANMHQMVQQLLADAQGKEQHEEEQESKPCPLLQTIAQQGNLAAFRWLMDRFPAITFGSSLLWFAAHGGSVEVLKLLVTRENLKVSSSDVCEAAAFGHVKAFRYLQSLCDDAEEEESNLSIWQRFYS